MAAAVVTSPVLASIWNKSVRIAGQAVGNGVVGRVQVERVGGHTHRSANADVLRDFVGSCIAIGGHSDVEFIHIDDGDVERLAGYRTVAAGRFDGDRTGGSVHFAIDCCSRGDDTTVGVDVEQSVGIAGQAVGNGVVGRIQVECVGSNAHGGTNADVLVTSLVAVSLSVGTLTLNSSTSMMAMLND